MSNRKPRGLLDTCVVIDLEKLMRDQLPLDGKIAAVSVSELMLGIHIAKDPAERSLRVNRLISVEANFDPLPFERRATTAFNALVGMTVAIGRNPKPRKNDLMIAATAVANGLPLYTANAEDFKGLESMLEVVEVRRA
jgi:predicted nucleic acid-binding protein